MSEPSVLLSIIIVSFNTKSLTIQTLESVVQELKQSKLDQQTEIFVVDNNSTDGSISSLHAFKKESNISIHIILNEENKGFGAANNQAIAQAQGKYIFLLNSDTVIQPGAIQKLLSTFAETPDRSSAETASHHGAIDHLGILAPTLQNADGTIQAQGGSMPTLLSVFAQMSLLDDIPVFGKLLPSTQHTGKRATFSQKAQLTPMDWVSGAAMMLKRVVIEEIGPLDEHIFMYGEDMEWCMRAKNHLWDVAIHNQAFITHLQSKSSSSQNAITGELRGLIYIWSKHKPLWQLSILKAFIKMGIFLRIGLHTILGNTDRAKIYRKSYVHLFAQA